MGIKVVSSLGLFGFAHLSSRTFVIYITKIGGVQNRKISERAARAKGLVVRIVGEENVVPVLFQVSELAGGKTKYREASLGNSLISATAVLSGSDTVITRDPALNVVEETLRLEDVKPRRQFSKLFPFERLS